MKKILLLITLASLLAGCASAVKYAPFGEWSSDVRTLGQVTAESGGWPLSLHTPPPEYTFYSALRKKASSTYHVPENEIVLGEVDVKFMSEIDGTIRSWTASATAGQKPQAATAAGSPKTP